MRLSTMLAMAIATEYECAITSMSIRETKRIRVKNKVGPRRVRYQTVTVRKYFPVGAMDW